MYILDTNALSENTKRLPNRGYTKWLTGVEEIDLYTSCLSVGEAQKGVLLLRDHAHRARVERYTQALVDAFADKILAVDDQTTLIWARITANASINGLTPPVIDALIAAQAIQHSAILVTRNTKDFAQFKGLKMLCPWD